MKRIFYLGSFLLLLLSNYTMAQEGSGKIKIRITNENGVMEKEYDSAEAVANDPELKEMGVEVETRDGGIKMMSKGSGNQSVVIHQNSGDAEGNTFYLQQGTPDSSELGNPPAGGWIVYPPMGALSKAEIDSLMKESLSLRHLHDSLRAEHMEKRIRMIEERKEEMQRRMEARREFDRPERPRIPVRGKQLIIIEDLSKEEASNLGINNQKLQLEDLEITPDPEAGSLDLRFRANSKDQVSIKISDQDGRLLLDDVFPLSDKSFDENIGLQDFRKGIYYLQIMQDKKVLARKIRVE